MDARSLYIPEIPDLRAVPTKRVKRDKEDPDDKAIIFVKLTLPKDKCDPLPKPKAGGLLGLVADVADKIADTVLDAACNLEFPIIKGNLPDWLDLAKFPASRATHQLDNQTLHMIQIRPKAKESQQKRLLKPRLKLNRLPHRLTARQLKAAQLKQSPIAVEQHLYPER